MRIGEVAAATCSSIRSLRYYEAQGLIAPQRLSNGYRVYDTDTVEHVRRIRMLIDAGFNVRTIRQVLPCIDGTAIDMCPAVAAAIQQAVAEMDARIGDLNMRRARILQLLDGR
ncbi:MAG: MerR family transcriptional regulator [Actinomycetota bacterium]